jgi:hypothetical protein
MFVHNYEYPFLSISDTSYDWTPIIPRIYNKHICRAHVFNLVRKKKLYPVRMV